MRSHSQNAAKIIQTTLTSSKKSLSTTTDMHISGCLSMIGKQNAALTRYGITVDILPYDPKIRRRELRRAAFWSGTEDTRTPSPGLSRAASRPRLGARLRRPYGTWKVFFAWGNLKKYERFSWPGEKNCSIAQVFLSRFLKQCNSGLAAVLKEMYEGSTPAGRRMSDPRRNISVRHRRRVGMDA